MTAIVMASHVQAGPQLTVSPNTADVAGATIQPDDCTAVLEYRADGSEWSSDGGGIATISRGNWLDAGSAADVWIQRTINTGSLFEDEGAGRVQASSGTYRLSTFQSGASTGTAAANVTIEFWDASTGGNLLGSVTLNITAEVTA